MQFGSVLRNRAENFPETLSIQRRPNLVAIPEFLDMLYGGSTGFLAVVKIGEESGQPDHTSWINWPEQQAYAEKMIATNSDEDVYVSVALYSQKERASADKDAKTRVVYADADTCHPSNFRLSPSISVQTSKGRWHCYWLLDGEVSADLASEASRKIAVAHESQGCDKSGWIKTKILRVPGTTNTKHGRETVEATMTGEIYTLAEINKAYSDISLHKVETSDREKPPFGNIDELEQSLVGTPMADLYMLIPQPGQSWSERLYRLEIDLFRAGYNAQDVFTLAWNAQCNKYHPRAAGSLTQSGVPIPLRTDGEHVLWREVTKAEGEHRLETQVVIADPEPQELGAFHFVTDDELKMLAENPTFIDEFVAWVHTKSPQSSVRLRRSAAVTLLSCVYGDKGHLKHGWQNEKLNIWVFSLGASSVAKKTTIQNLWLEVLDKYGVIIGDNGHMIANDFTAEALNKSLSERDGKVSVIVRDEVHGLLKEVMGKGYKAGLKETLTNLYNGQVQIALRMNKDSAQKKKATTVFNLYASGTPMQVVNELTLDDFGSGFMVRPVFANASDVSLTKDNDRLDYFADENKSWTRDDTAYRMARRFAASTAKMSDTAIDISRGANDRFARWQDTMFDVITGMKNEQSIRAMYSRLKITVMKTAALLAMSEDSYEVTERHVIAAIHQAQFWFEDFLYVLNQVTGSDFQREANEILAYVRAGTDGRRNKANVMRTFSQYRTRQFNEYIESLMEQGRIQMVRDGKIVYLEAVDG